MQLDEFNEQRFQSFLSNPKDWNNIRYNADKQKEFRDKGIYSDTYWNSLEILDICKDLKKIKIKMKRKI